MTPRQTTLHRARDLAGVRTVLAHWIAHLAPADASNVCVVVPTRAAAEQLRRTIEDRLAGGGRTAIVWPHLVTRCELYDELRLRLAAPPVVASAFEREILLDAAARAARESGHAAPFDLRPALVAEMLALYDQIRRLGRSVDDFARNIGGDLEREQDSDRGAARLLEQTLFLAEAFAGYERRLAASMRCDEHGVRERLIACRPARPIQRIVLAVADWIAEPEGMWPADFELLARLPALERLDLIATEAVLAAGYLERLHAAFPDLDESRIASEAPPPVLIAPPEAPPDRPCFSYRDREEELHAVARRIKHDRRTGEAAPLHRTALIVRRPLPYLYLARHVFREAGIAFEAVDTLPLAAEPYAAAVDLVLDAVASDFTRASLIALLGCPHFRIARAAPIADCDAALADARYLGGLDRLQALVDAWAAILAPASRHERRVQRALPAVRALLDAARELSPLAATRPMTDQIATLVAWLRRHATPPDPDAETTARTMRVQAAIHGALAALASAYARHAPSAEGDVEMLGAALRRWLGSQTFAETTGENGLRILDASAARFADLDDVQIVGLIEGEWPERPRRNIFYPPSLLSSLEPAPATANPAARERQAAESARAAFRDLLRSASARVRLSTFVLENDAVVEPSVLIDDVAAAGLSIVRMGEPSLHVTLGEALARGHAPVEAMAPQAAAWAAMRLGADLRPPACLRGEAGCWTLPRVSVSRLELYLSCPFKFFASQVLGIDEPPDDADTQTPLERGRFLHELWERFFTEWQQRGRGRIDAEHLDEARALFTELCEDALARLPAAEAAIERARLLGSAAGPGIAHRVFELEAARPAPILERLLELKVDGEFDFPSPSGDARRVAIRAVADRVDVLEGGRLRVIDYKSRSIPDPEIALQLPIYAHLARAHIAQRRPGSWTIDEALYLAFEGKRPVVPLEPEAGEELEECIERARRRLVETLDRIGAGHFPPRPIKKSLCTYCAYRTICRLDIVPADAPPAAAEDAHE